MQPIQNGTLTQNQLSAQYFSQPMNSSKTADNDIVANILHSVAGPNTHRFLKNLEGAKTNFSAPENKHRTTQYSNLLPKTMRAPIFSSNADNISNVSTASNISNARNIGNAFISSYSNDLFVNNNIAVSETDKKLAAEKLKMFAQDYQAFLDEVKKLKSATQDGVSINTYKLAQKLVALREKWAGISLAKPGSEAVKKFWESFSCLKFNNSTKSFEINLDSMFRPIIDALDYRSDAYDEMVRLGSKGFGTHFQDKEFSYSKDKWSVVDNILQKNYSDSYNQAFKISSGITPHDEMMEKFIKAAQNMDKEYVREVEKAVTKVKEFLEEYANVRNEIAKLTEFKDGKRIIPNNLHRYLLVTLKKKWENLSIGKISGNLKREFWERFPILKVDADGNVKVNSEYLLEPSIKVLEKLGTPWKVGKYDEARLEKLYDKFKNYVGNFTDFLNSNKSEFDAISPTEEWSETEWLQVNTALDNASRNLNSEISSIANAYSTAISDSSRFYNLLSSFIDQLRQADLEFVKSI